MTTSTQHMELEEEVSGIVLSASASTDSLADSLPDQSIADVLRRRAAAPQIEAHDASAQTLPPLQPVPSRQDASVHTSRSVGHQHQGAGQASPSQLDPPSPAEQQPAPGTTSRAPGSGAQTVAAALGQTPAPVRAPPQERA